jgi:acetolactate synthase I/II/III large subunit
MAEAGGSRRCTGAQAVIRSLERQGVKHVFGLPGGAAIPLFDALVGSSIRLVQTRHEQGATHMADGFARACGEPGVVLVTSGPGATNTITGIFTAQMDSVPMVVITGQQSVGSLGLDSFQEADVSGIALPVVKHSYLVKNAADIPRIIREAFHLSRTGRPGPVLIDVPKDCSAAVIDYREDDAMRLPGYRVPEAVDGAAVAEAARLLAGAKRPVLLVGHGVVISGAGAEVRAFAERMRIPVVNTLLGKGGFPETHPLSLGMLGMHGTAYANKAVADCDLIMSIGSRWDDRITLDPNRFCAGAVKIHVDIDPAEIGKVFAVDCAIVGDARAAIAALDRVASPGDTADWIARVEAWRAAHPLRYDRRGGLKTQAVIDELYRLTGGRAVVVTDVGQHQMWAAQFYRTDERFHWISSGGAGTMGFGFPASIGAQLARPRDLVCAIVGDGGFQMTFAELATAVTQKVPVKVIVSNNRYLGMVRQWQNLFWDNRLSGVDLAGNPDFVKLAQSYGCRAFRVRRTADVRPVLEKALAYTDGPCLVDAEVVKEEDVFPMVPAGASLADMILGPPRKGRSR